MHMYVQFGKLKLPGYGLMIASGIIVANIIAFFIVRKKKLNIYELIILEGYGILGAAIGAKALYFFTARHIIDWDRMLEMEYFNEQMRVGFVFYGGLIGGMIFLVLAARIHNINLFSCLKDIIVLIPLMHGFGRLGCYCAGCCYGRPYNGVLAVIFPKGGIAPAGIPLFPVQLVEAGCLFLLAFLLYILSKQTEDAMLVTAYYIVGYSIIRFVLEFVRADVERGICFGVSTSQWISIVLFGVSVIYIVKRIKNKERLLPRE